MSDITPAAASDGIGLLWEGPTSEMKLWKGAVEIMGGGALAFHYNLCRHYRRHNHSRLGDGVRRRLHVLLGEDEQNKLHMVLETDRFTASQPIVLKEDFSDVRFRVESDNQASHVARLHLSGLAAGSYALLDGSRTIAAVNVKDGQETVVELSLPAGARSKSFSISRRPVANH